MRLETLQNYLIQSVSKFRKIQWQKRFYKNWVKFDLNGWRLVLSSNKYRGLWQRYWRGKNKISLQAICWVKLQAVFVRCSWLWFGNRIDLRKRNIKCFRRRNYSFEIVIGLHLILNKSPCYFVIINLIVRE